MTLRLFFAAVGMFVFILGMIITKMVGRVKWHNKALSLFLCKFLCQGKVEMSPFQQSRNVPFCKLSEAPSKGEVTS
jgi:hypothetical protein